MTESVECIFHSICSIGANVIDLLGFWTCSASALVQGSLHLDTSSGLSFSLFLYVHRKEVLLKRLVPFWYKFEYFGKFSSRWSNGKCVTNFGGKKMLSLIFITFATTNSFLSSNRDRYYCFLVEFIWKVWSQSLNQQSNCVVELKSKDTSKGYNPQSIIYQFLMKELKHKFSLKIV